MKLTGRTYLVTGGTGFIGASLIPALLDEGIRVRCLDNDSRGSQLRLAASASKVEFVEGDVRDPAAVEQAVQGVDGVIHLAYVNGTESFYTRPELVLEVAVKGVMNLLDACLAANVREFILASSSEVYQTPPHVPTSELVPLSVPDPLNPRFSYGGGKIIAELLTVNYGRKYFDRILIFRPHNVFGPDMGRDHVIPQLILRLIELAAEVPEGVIELPIQGTGEETRAFVYIDDFVDGVMRLLARGEHLNVYNVGSDQQTTIAELAQAIAACYGRSIRLIPGPRPPGATLHRCPDIGKIRELGYNPHVSLRDGLERTVRWYVENEARKSKA
jgi:nucleoside-diphosphate-sugar epimerase